jgi:hypothetical protein
LIKVRYWSCRKLNGLNEAFRPDSEWQRSVVKCASFKWQQWWVAKAPCVHDGYADHLREEMAVFKVEDFDAQTYVLLSPPMIGKGIVSYHHVFQIVVVLL